MIKKSQIRQFRDFDVRVLITCLDFGSLKTHPGRRHLEFMFLLNTVNFIELMVFFLIIWFWEDRWFVLNEVLSHL